MATAYVLLVLDAIAKIMIAPAFRLGYPELAADWSITAGVQLAALAVIGIVALRQVAFKPTDLMPVAIGAVTAVAASALLAGFYDFSFDGQWYHEKRVLMFPAPWPIIGLDPGSVDAAVSYPLLIDNLRGLLVSAIGTGANRGVAVNVGLAATALYFWQRHADFISRWLRWIPALGPVAASQLLSQYTDGPIASLGGMLLLATLAPRLDRRDKDAAEPTAFAGYVVAGALATLLLMQLKYSFPLLLCGFGLPALILALGQPREVWGSIAAEARQRAGLLAILAPTAIAATANPYFLVADSLLRPKAYPFFTIATLHNLSNVTIVGQAQTAFGPGVPQLAYFIKANLLAVWPGFRPDLVEPGIQGIGPIAKSLIVRLGTVDARFSGFGPLSVLVLLYAAVLSARAIRRWWPNRSGKTGTAGLDIAPLLALTFVGEVVCAIVLPLAWWARMFPPVYTVALMLLTMHKDHEGGKRDKTWSIRAVSARRHGLQFSLIALATLALVAPPAITVAKSRFKAGQLRQGSMPLLQPAIGTTGKNIAVPQTCPQSSNDALNLALLLKTLHLHPEARTNLSMVPTNSCPVKLVEVVPGQPVCVCDAGP